MKLKFWISGWYVIIAACAAEGISTRASYAVLSHGSPEVMNSYYMYSVDASLDVDPTRFTDTTYQSLASQSKLIITCRFDGARKIENEYLLSEVRVSQVIKGNQALRNQEIQVEEPVSMYTDSIEHHNMANDFNELVAKFGWQGKKQVLVSRAADGITKSINYALMGENQEYLLFLNPPELLPGQPAYGVGYQPLDSPYAKLTVSNLDAATYRPPAGEISFKEAKSYEIFLQDPSFIIAFFNM